MGYVFYQDNNCETCNRFAQLFCDSCGKGICNSHRIFLDITPNNSLDVCRPCMKAFGPKGKIGRVLLNAGKVSRY